MASFTVEAAQVRWSVAPARQTALVRRSRTTMPRNPGCLARNADAAGNRSEGEGDTDADGVRNSAAGGDGDRVTRPAPRATTPSTTTPAASAATSPTGRRAA